MKNNVIITTLILTLFQGCAHTTSCQSNALLATTQRPLLIIGQDKETMLEYIRATNSKPDGFMTYTSLKRMEGLKEAAEYGSGIQHAQFFAKKYPCSILQIGLYLVNDLKDINEGRLDGNIKKLALWCKQARLPILLRIGYEFDYPPNNYAPKEYSQAFRRIVDYFRKENVDNVSFVWHSAAVAKKPEQWYPGDAYADWCAISFFDVSHLESMRSMAEFAKSHHKPFMIAESTPLRFNVTDGKHTWEGWFEPFFNFIRENNIKIICYINSNWENLPMFRNQGWPNARIQDNQYVTIHWLDTLTNMGVR